MTHICVSKLTIIGSDNGLSPGRRQAVIWTNAGILLIGPYGTNFSEISIQILTFSFTKRSLKVMSAKWRLFYLGLNVLSTVFGAVTSTRGATLKDLSKWVSITHKGQRVIFLYEAEQKKPVCIFHGIYSLLAPACGSCILILRNHISVWQAITMT